MNHGVYIDIFPLDYYLTNRFSQFYLKVLSKVENGKIGRALSDNHLSNRSFRQKVFELISDFKYKDTQNALMDYESKIKKYKKLFRSLGR